MSAFREKENKRAGGVAGAIKKIGLPFRYGI
jgi:hypothetical protein